MRRLNLSWGLILVLIGTIWVLQGLDVAFAPKSFMTGDRWWVVWGSVAILVGLVALWRGFRDPPSDNHSEG